MGLRFYQAKVAQDIGFRAAMLASTMKVAYDVLTKDTTTTPDAALRKRAAVTMYGDIGNNRERMVELFCWYAVFIPAVQSKVYNIDTGTVTPEALDDGEMDALVSNFWTAASKILAEAGPV